MRRILCLLILMLCAVRISAQEELSTIWKLQLDQWAFSESNTDIEETADLLTQLHEQPVNLNDSSQHLRLFFLTPSQTNALRYYLNEYGQILTFTELRFIPGFDSATIALLLPISTIDACREKEPLTLQNILSHSAQNLTIGTSRHLELSRGYIEDRYEGSPFRIYSHYSLNYHNRIKLQLSIDKDPGEAIFADGQTHGFDFYGFHLMANDIWKLSRFAVGQYRLQFGQGLTLWNGPLPWHSAYGSNFRSAQKIARPSPFSEYGYLQGAAATIRMTNHIDLTTFYSNLDIDASTAADGTVSSISYSGYHRTTTEKAKKDALNEQVVGFNLDYSSRRLHIGTTLHADLFSKEIVPTPQIYNQNFFSGRHNVVCGTDVTYQLHYTTLFGELSCSQNGGWAGIVGTHTPLGNGNQINCLIRNYSPDYQNHHASSWGQNSTNQNEQGVCLSLRYRLPFHIDMMLYDDHFRHPWIKYQTYSPTSGNEQGLILTRSLTQPTQITLSYHRKEYGRNGVDSCSHTFSVEQVTRHSLKARISYSVGPIIGQTDANFSRFDCELHKRQSGFLLSQQVAYHQGSFPLWIECRYSLFDVPDYDAALYAVEGDLRYEYSSSSYSHQGMRFYILIRYNLTDKIRFSAKYAVTSITDEESIGSGYDLIPHRHRQTIKLQVHCSF